MEDIWAARNEVLIVLKDFIAKPTKNYYEFDACYFELRNRIVAGRRGAITTNTNT